jgi:negative regulator of replication initiation
MPRIELYTLLDLVGDLSDSTEAGSASARFRKYLRENIQQVSDVRAYVSDALGRSGDQYYRALQDLINHAGELLGFKVVYGRYRGIRGAVGFDGLWQSPTGWSIVVETKTTDVYVVKTATLLGYINNLISEGQLQNPNNVLGLYVYGRFDAQTTQLENAISVEGRRERLRVVSVEALLHLLALQQEYRLSHNTLLGLLLPAQVRVDALVNLILDIVAQEKEDATIVQKTQPESELLEQSSVITTPKRKGHPSNLVSLAGSYTGKTVRTVTFRNERHEVHTWKDAAQVVFEALRGQDQQAFEHMALSLIGRKRPYITRNKEELRVPGSIPNTSLYFETNLSANMMIKLCHTLVNKMGYGEADLVFETEE